jgi:NAD(P)-dependent dehydrogenase (short-subunit alcohol dehydrogenase family)
MRRAILLCLALLSAVPSLVFGAEAKAVLVTGASSGIGRMVTERLAARGYFVYATARKDADLQALGAIKNVQALKLDQTKPQDIAAAVEAVKRAGRGLYGIVNNAGIGTGGAVFEASDEELELALATNVAGPWRITQAFGPMVVESKGRIVTIGSVSGILAGKNTSVYVMTKHAMEGFVDSLGAELEPLGVQVSIVEPGNYSTQIYMNAVERMHMDAKRGDMSKFPPPDDVAAAVQDALFAAKPKRRYLVTPVEDQAKRTIQKQIQQLVQLNEGQKFTYDRDTLVKMLDEALAGSRARTPPAAPPTP